MQMNKKGIIHISVFLTVTIGIHLIFLANDINGKFAFLVIIPSLYGLIHLSKGLMRIFQKGFKNGYQSVLNGLLFVLISTKIHYEYYNVLIGIGLTILGLLVVFKPKGDLNLRSKQSTICIALLAINLALILTPDSWLLSYFNFNQKVHGTPLSWQDFRKEVDANEPQEASISTDFKYKVNKLYNYPPAVLLATMNPDSSGRKRTNSNKYDKYDYILLEHEQGHFDITEFCKQKALDSINNSWGESPDQIESIVFFYIKERHKMQRAYDSVTNHGLDTLAHYEWVQMLKNKDKRQLTTKNGKGWALE